MNNFSRLFNLKSLLLMLVFVSSAMAFTSCGDDDDEPYGSKSLVGTWYCEDDGESQEFVFDDKGNVSYTNYTYPRESWKGTYTYKSGDPYVRITNEWGTDDPYLIVFTENNELMIEGYGIFHKKK